VFFDEGVEPLTEPTAKEFIASGGIARIGISAEALPLVLPVNYQYLGGDVRFATSSIAALRAARRTDVIALSVDSMDTLARWEWSVHVVGQSAEITDPTELDELHMLGLMPLTGQQPAHYVRLRTDIITGYRRPSP